MSDKYNVSRRTSLISMGVLGASAVLGSAAKPLSALEPPKQTTNVRKTLFEKVWNTTLIDTHEHLGDEQGRLESKDPGDWARILSHYYLRNDLLVAGISADDIQKLHQSKLDPLQKWKLLEPYWPAVKNTGYGLAIRISLRELYGADELSARTVEKIQTGFEALRKPGFYNHIFRDLCKIESCQVNWLEAPVHESSMPDLMMQDLSILGMFSGPDFSGVGNPTGIEVKALSDWHKVIDWWFHKYSKYVVAVKTQDAYARDIDYTPTPAEAVEGIFKKKLQKEPITAEEKKALENHLFWYAVGKATENNLPVKMHTGYYAGENYMPLNRLRNNAGSACELCRTRMDTRFVFMHICYPYYEELLAVAKQYTNAHVDMCWGWIINPIAAKDFLKKYLVTAPSNKIVTFGGDQLMVEQVPGHAVIARRGIALALSELVEEGWLSLPDAMDLVDPIMHGNARRIFRLNEKPGAIL